MWCVFVLTLILFARFYWNLHVRGRQKHPRYRQWIRQMQIMYRVAFEQLVSVLLRWRRAIEAIWDVALCGSAFRDIYYIVRVHGGADSGIKNAAAPRRCLFYFLNTLQPVIGTIGLGKHASQLRSVLSGTYTTESSAQPTTSTSWDATRNLRIVMISLGIMVKYEVAFFLSVSQIIVVEKFIILN